MPLEPGDILFVGWDSDNDDIAFIATTDLSAGEVIYFTDDERDETGFFGSEQMIEWTVPAGGVPAGTVVTIDMDPAADTINFDSGGDVDYIKGGYDIAGRNEMFWAFQGTRDGNAITPTNYVAVIGNEADGRNTQTPNLTGTGLTTSNGAVIIDGDEDYMEWTADGTLPIQQEDLIASILDLDNWTTADGTGVQNTGGGFNVETQNVVCFARGTKISTCEGAIEIEKLRVGQKIVTLAAGAEKIRWIGVIKLSSADLAENPKLRPVRIRAGALGKGLPKQDLLVSRQHRILVSSKVAERMFGLRDVLIPAVRLTNLPDIFIDETIDSISYYHILCDDHQVVFAEGAPAETLFLGKETAHSLSIDAQEEIETLFPGLVGQQCPTRAAQMIIDLPRQNRLIARHIKNNKPMLETYRN